MTLTTIAAMFSAMVALAVIPDASALAVTARSISFGFKHGVIVVVGILAGDLIFILLAVFGLSAISQMMDSLFHIIKYFGAAYLVFLGLFLWKDKPQEIEIKAIENEPLLSGFLCGFFITLSDPKAILFYISFLPAFIDLPIITIPDAGIILATAIAALSCTKLVYAFMADKSRVLFKSSKAKQRINLVSGGIMIATGLFLALHA